MNTFTLKSSIPALLFVASVTATPVFAESPLEETVISSSRVPTPLRQLGTSVSVIDAEEIQARGFLYIADVLRYEPSVSVNNSGGAGKASALHIRGESGYRTKVLLDGIDITDTSTPQNAPHFELLTSTAVHRVEILRGPQGMMYGADSGGVINMSTRSAEPGLNGGIDAEYGSHGSRQLAAHLNGGNTSVDFAVFGSQLETDGFNSKINDTVLRDDDGARNSTVHGRIGWNIFDSLRAEVVAHRVEGENQFDDCFPVDFTVIGNSHDCNDTTDQNSWRTAISHSGERFSNRLAYAENKFERESFSDGLSSFAAVGELERIEYLGSWKVTESHSLVYGADFISEALDDGFFASHRDQDGYYLEYQGSFNQQSFVTAGLRQDRNDDFGDFTTWRLSGAHFIATPVGELKLRASYGTGFRAPSLYEITYNRSSAAFPPASSAQLDVEESEGFDLAISLTGATGWSVEAVYFDQQVNDELFFDLINFSGYLQDRGESTSSGIELIADYPLGVNFSLNGNYTYNDTETAGGEQRLRAPEHLANVGFSYHPASSDFSVNAHLRLARGLADERDGGIDDYEVVDISANYRLSGNLELYGRIVNLFDEDYREVPNYNTGGASAYLGLRFTF